MDKRKERNSDDGWEYESSPEFRESIERARQQIKEGKGIPFEQVCHELGLEVAKRRRIAMVVVDRANWGRLEPLAAAIQADKAFDLHVICGGTTVLTRFKAPANDIEQAGYCVSARVYHELEGSTPSTMTHSIGLGIIQYTTALDAIDPEFVVVIGDRYEALAATIAAAYTGRCIVHLQGGEVSGSLDELARHAITKLSHYHCPATARARENLIRMGERPSTILSVGCPSSDMALRVEPNPSGKLLVVYHPNTTQADSSLEMAEILTAVQRLGGMAQLWWPNADAGAESVAKTIRVWRQHNRVAGVEYITNVEPGEYQQMLADAACCIGNSSSFIRDSSFYGTPVVLVGSRQDGREHAENVMYVEPHADAIVAAVKAQYSKRYPVSHLYGDGAVSQRIVEALRRIEPYTQKRLAYEFECTGSDSGEGRVEGYTEKEPCTVAG